MTIVLRLTLTAAVAYLSWVFGGGAAGLLTLALYAVGVMVGLPFGFLLFGRGGAAWAAGALIGYGLLSLGFWIPIALGWVRPGAFVYVWLMLLLLGGVMRSACKGITPLVPLPEWTRGNSAALLLVLHLVPLLVGAPFARAGEQDAEGTRYYRAYFTADFVWHMALANELARFEPELKNPYFANEKLTYYWTYFLPATVIGTRGETGALTHVEGALKTSAMMSALLLLAMIYCAAWAATGRVWAAAAASLIALMAPSFEGLYVLRDLLQRGQPLDALRSINIDAVSAWPQYPFRGFRIDGLQRSMWWTPQHATSCALGLIAVIVASRGRIASMQGILFTGLALGLSVTFNPLLGAIFCAVYGATVLWDVATRRVTIADGLRHALTVVPVAVALAWCVQAGMSEGASAVSFGLHEYARRAPFAALFISLGGVLIPAAIGLFPSARVAFRPALPALVALALALVLMHFVTITESSWVGFRAGNIILVTVGMLVARGLVVAASRAGVTLAVALAAVLFAAGVPTTAIDWYNARDLENRRMGPGFLWVIPFTADQQAGFDWIRRATPPDAVVQFDPVVHGRQNWSGIPTFTGRRMAAGIPISLLPTAEHNAQAAEMHRILVELPPEEAHAALATRGVDYVWIDGDDRRARTAGSLDRLFARPDLFAPLFSAGETAVLAVAR